LGLYARLSAARLFLIVAVGAFGWTRWQYHLPNDRQARQQFDSHRTEFIRFASLLRQAVCLAFRKLRGTG
jgi:hypothetical protein